MFSSAQKFTPSAHGCTARPCLAALAPCRGSLEGVSRILPDHSLYSIIIQFFEFVNSFFVFMQRFLQVFSTKEALNRDFDIFLLKSEKSIDKTINAW